MGNTRNTGYLQNIVQYDASNNIILPSLPGTGNRMVVTSSTGLLSSQAIPTLSSLSGVPTSRTLTINGVTYDLSSDRTWSVIPTGGTTGQLLAKSSSTDYATQWIDNYTSQVKHEVKLAEAISIGTPVYVSGSTGQAGTNMLVSKSSNATEATSSKTLGLLAFTGVTNDIGFVITEGLLSGLDTSAAGAVGDPVWLGVNGALIYGLANKPYAPAHLVFIGVVTRKQQNNGEIFVKVQNGFELEELHDLSVRNPSDGDMIKYVASTGLWTKIAATTTNITEGTRLYYTDARVGTYLTANNYATQSYVSTQIANLVNSAPTTLDTLNELALALGNDANFATTVTNSIATKLALSGGTLTGNLIGNSGFEILNGQFYKARRNSGNLLTDMIGIPSGTDDVRILTTGDFNVINGSLTNILAVKNNGSIGIGTVNPIARLTIDGDYADMSGTITYSTNTRGIVINQDAGGGYGTGLWFRQAGLTAGIGSTRVSSADWATDLRFYTHPSSTTNQNILYERMRISSEGNVGVNTTNPGTKFEVFDSDNSGNRTSPINILTITADNNSNPYDGFGGGLLFKNRIYSGGPSAGGIQNGARIRTSLRTNSIVNYGTELVFDVTTTGNGSLTEVLRLSYTDGATFSYSVRAPKTFINTSLDYGNLNILGYDNSSINIIDQRTATSGLFYSAITFRDYYLGSGNSIKFYHNQYFGGGVNKFAFSINGDDKLTILNNGNLGVGTINPSEPLSVSFQAHGLISQHRQSNGLGVGQNFYMKFNDASGAAVNYAGIYADIQANTTGAHSGRMILQVANAGSLLSAVTISNNGAATFANSITATQGIFSQSSGGVFTATATTSWSSGFMNHSTFLASGMTGGGLSIGFGKSSGTYNLAKVVYNHIGDASASNYIGLGFWDKDNILNIVATGRVAIGLASPEAGLHVAQPGQDDQLILGSSANNRDHAMFMYSGPNKAEVLRYQSGQRLIIGAGGNISNLDVVPGGNGVRLSSGNTSWSAYTSDARRKKNFETVPGLDAIMQVEPVKYHFKTQNDSEVKKLGFIAQNILPLIPEMVHPNGEKEIDGSDILTIIPDYILPVLVKAIQELTAKVNALENK